MERHLLGKWGEQTVGQELERLGWNLVRYNYRGGQDEIDLIAEDGVYLIFVEVKTREISSMALGVEAVTKNKQRHLYRCAQHFLMSAAGEPYRDLQPRFDVAEITVDRTAETETILTYYENAF